jgi:hypothetical protein
MTKQLSLAVASWDDIWPTVGEKRLVHENVPVRFRILPARHGWTVLRDASSGGDFVTRNEAYDFVRAAMTVIFSRGGSAQVRFA